MKMYAGIAIVALVSFDHIIAQSSYRHAAKIVFSDTRVTQLEAQASYPADISYLFADLKYRDNEVKICEFGPARRASIASSEVIYGGRTISMPTPYWPLLWEYLTRLSVPVWSVGPIDAHFERCLPTSHRLTSLKALELSQDFVIRKKNDVDGRSLAYSGVVVYTHVNRYNSTRKQLRTDFKQTYPDILFLDGAAHLYANNKLELARLLDRPDLQKFKPRWKNYKKQYTPRLAQKILKDIQADTVVIKPINSSRANGVIIVHASDLDATLKQILAHTLATNHVGGYKNYAPSDKTQTYEYWKNDPNNAFMVESFEESKSIRVRGALYDPTMRVVFILRHEAGKIYTTILGGYWDIPAKHLGDKAASFTDKHKTILMPEGEESLYMGLKIAEQDFTSVKEVLYKILPKIYEQMLSNRR